MKNKIKYLSYLVIFLATILLVVCYSLVWGTGRINISFVPKIEFQESIAFEKFPLKKTQIINFQTDERSFSRLNDREKKEQFRDWLLLTIASDRSFTIDKTNESLYDIYPIRYGYMKPVSNFEYGNTRSFYMGEGKVIALLPKIISRQGRLYDLANIADKHRKNLGKKPKTIEIFEYELYPEENKASLTRTEEINAETIFTAQYSYQETEIRNLNDLKILLTKINDITFTQLNGSSLILGGRKINPYGGIKVEEIAAIWKSEKQIQEKPEKFKVSGSGFSLDWGHDYQAMQAELEKVKPLLQSLKLNNKPILTDEDFQKAKEYLTQKENGMDSYKKLLKKLDHNIANNSESYNQQFGAELKVYKNQKHAELDAELKKYQEYKEQVQKELNQEQKIAFEDAINSGKSPEKIKQKLDLIYRSKQKELDAYKDKIDKFNIQKEQEIKYFIEKLKEKKARINHFLKTPISQGFQFARYDGNLQGTEVGMVLFYTDLLAKIWSFDYANSTPEAYIKGFQPNTKITVSSIYNKEIKDLSSTRIWFEPNSKGFQIVDAPNSLIFSRNATKISARSSASAFGQPDQEVAPTAIDDIFINWWYSHYEEVARYEPQYEKLNEIMKWSLLISWLNESGQGNRLSFLGKVNFKDDYWFPNWVQANKKHLKFTNWDSQSCQGTPETDPENPKPVCFYKRGAKGQKTETMNLLVSGYLKQFGGNRNFIVGGVSLADQGLFQKRKPLPISPTISEAGLRSNIDYGSIKSDGRNFKFSFKNLDATEYSFQNFDPFRASSTAKAKDGTKLRSPETELANLEMTRNIFWTDEGIQINIKADGIDLGDFRTTETRNGFQVGFRSRDMDAGQSLALEFRRSGKDPESFFSSHPQVESVAKQAAAPPPVYIVKMKGNKSWVQLTPEGGRGGGGKKPSKWQSRVGRFGDPKKPGNPPPPSDGGQDNYLLAWIDNNDVQQLLSERKAKCLRGNCKPSQANPIGIERDYEKATQKLADDPRAFIGDQKKHLNRQLDEIDGFLKSKKYDEAARELDSSIKIYGRKPDLIIRKALIEIKRGIVKAKSIEFDSQRSIWMSRKGNFLDEINGLLGNNNTDQKNRFKGNKKDDALIYIQDTPGLNNIDWNQPIEASLPFVSSKTRVYKLQLTEIGEIKLSTLGFENENTSFKVSKDYQIHRGKFSNSYQPSQEEECEEEQEQLTQCIQATEKGKSELDVYIIFESI